MRALLSYRRVAAIALVGTLSACSGGGGSHTVPSAANSGSQGAAPSSLTSILYPSTRFTSTTTRLNSPMNIGTLVMHVVVNLQNGPGLAAYAAATSNPADSRYRQFLTASQIGAQYGARASDYTTVANYFASYGLKVGGYPQRLALTVAGTTAQFQSALGTTFSLYKSAEGHTLIAPSGTIHFAKGLPVTSIADAVLDPVAKHLQYVQGASGGPQIGSIGGNTPFQIATAFDYTSAYAAGYTGKGITIGIIGTGPIDATFGYHDFKAFHATYGFPGGGVTGGTSTLTEAPVTPAAAANNIGDGSNGGSPTSTPPAVTAPCATPSNPFYPPSESPSATCNPEDFEAQIDTEQASLAYNANISFYLAYVNVECGNPTTNTCAADPSTGYGYTYQGLAESDDEIQQAIADNNGGSTGPDILSLSYGGPEVLNGFYNQNALGNYDPSGFGPSEFAALAAEGVAVFVSSGDDGAEGCAPYSLALETTPCVSYPAGDVSVTSVGGIFVPLNNAGQYVGPITAWGTQTNSGGASGGGTSSITPVPAWQVGTSVPTGFRSQPDISLEGDPDSGIGVLANTDFTGTQVSIYGGTSVAAPESAAMWALVLQACAQTPACARAGGPKPYRLGNAAPYFYTVYNSATLYPDTFYDVTFGTNALVGCSLNGSCGPAPTPTPGAGYTAGVGYDLVTGIGVPFARHLIKAVVGV
ncbi:MAG: protease pro-enzyme activation domain-containing protein [Vulcanimicrobiaceae bacterium]|jgi:subtilase family serine protease